MKKISKIILSILGVLILVITSLLGYVKFFLPDVGEPPDLVAEKTTENIERGKYLANHVMVCIDCHSTRDWNLFAAPLVPGTEGKGGEVFDQQLGFPGKYVAGNITPKNLGNWTDGEIFRAITSGVSKDGTALFSIMPHHNFGQLDKKDIESVIVYLRTLQTIDFTPEKSKSDFPMNFIVNTIPKKAELKPMPSKNDTVSYGEYLVTASGCKDCHTKQEKGKFVGELFAGGFDFKFPDGSIVSSSNITPHQNTGIGNKTKEQFVNLFKMYADSTYSPAKVSKGDFQTVMPWTMYAGMTNEDLEAIYDYLKTVKPIENSVTRFTAAK
ncbi:c-type cytochrome [bacterium]|nr:c-type cytochrome [bacterium]